LRIINSFKEPQDEEERVKRESEKKALEEDVYKELKLLTLKEMNKLEEENVNKPQKENQIESQQQKASPQAIEVSKKENIVVNQDAEKKKVEETTVPLEISEKKHERSKEEENSN